MGVYQPFTPDRFFSVMGEGWYVETRHGPVGPFSHRAQARHYLDALRLHSRWKRADCWPRPTAPRTRRRSRPAAAAEPPDRPSI